MIEPFDNKSFNAAWQKIQQFLDWSETIDDELLMMLVSSLDAEITRRNASESRDVWRGRWNPWRVLRRNWPHTRLAFFDGRAMQIRDRDVLYGWVEQTKARTRRHFGRWIIFHDEVIFLNDRLSRLDRWESLSHELTHLQRGLDRVGTSDWLRPDSMRNKEEAAVERAAMRRMHRAAFQPTEKQRAASVRRPAKEDANGKRQ